jgi:hypothetical protein
MPNLRAMLIPICHNGVESLQWHRILQLAANIYCIDTAHRYLGNAYTSGISDGPWASATLTHPFDCELDASGNLYW